jgi:hypothetical protein
MATAKKTTPRKPAAQPAAQPDGARQVLQVTAKRDGFRRAGRAWHGTSTVPLDELSEEQCLQLTSEPMLVTLLIELPAEAAEGEDAAET